MDNNTINILVVSDDYYAILMAAFLKSVELNHHTNEIVEVYIVDDNISKKNKQRIISSISSPKIKLNWLVMNEIIPKDIQLPLVGNSYPINTYIRVLIPHFIPKDIKKIIFFDVDMIMLDDVSKLWAIDTGDYVIGAVSDTIGTIPKTLGNGIENYQELGLDPDLGYFNAGLLVMNVDKWLQQDITKKTFDTINNNKKYAGLGDQYGLNISLAGNWHAIDPLWSCFSVNTDANPHLIHYFNVKPIYKDYSFNYKEEFYHYLNQTEWKGFRPISKLSRDIKKAKNKLKKLKIYLTK